MTTPQELYYSLNKMRARLEKEQQKFTVALKAAAQELCDMAVEKDTDTDLDARRKATYAEGRNIARRIAALSLNNEANNEHMIALAGELDCVDGISTRAGGEK